MPGDKIEVPLFKNTKGGGKRIIGTFIAELIYSGPEFITVRGERYNQTFTREEMQLLQTHREPAQATPKKRRKRRDITRIVKEFVRGGKTGA